MSTIDDQPVLHPNRGLHRPGAGTIARRPGSIRRTSTVDVLRPDGLQGRVVLDGHARDLVTRADGGIGLVESSALTAEIEFFNTRQLTAIASDPADPRLQELVGTSVASGFRGRVLRAVPDQRAETTRLHLLLDDLPVATLVGGYALQAGGALRPGSRIPLSGTPDLCSGWRSGGTLMAGIEQDGVPPTLTGPEAPLLDEADDPLGWHHRDPMPAHTVRRARRLDLTLEAGAVVLDSLFRDSHMDPDGHETVVHEYAVRGRVNRANWSILSLVATPHVLPWQECPVAAGSAGRLAGQDVRTLRDEVRKQLVGTSTCTHLNDQLRELADLPALVAALAL